MQVASHAQKYFIRMNTSSNKKDKRRSSIHDIEAPPSTAQPPPLKLPFPTFNPGLLTPEMLSQTLAMHHPMSMPLPILQHAFVPPT